MRPPTAPAIIERASIITHGAEEGLVGLASDRDLHAKFIDPTRHFVRAPRPYPEIELWVEKDSIRNFFGNLAARYRLSIQVLRGFASLSMYRKALLRAAGIETGPRGNDDEGAVGSQEPGLKTGILTLERW